MQDDTSHFVVGLGNPGASYTMTRHNVGWLVLDAWCTVRGCPTPHQSSRYRGLLTETVVGTTPVTVLYPDTFMNHSGQAVRKLVPTTALNRLVVVYDDIDIPFGTIKVSVGGGAAGHNGVASVTQALGSPAYVRLRVGIAPRHLITRQPVRPHGAALPRFVLQPFTAREQRQLPGILDTAAAALSTILTDGVAAAMNRYNGQ